MILGVGKNMRYARYKGAGIMMFRLEQVDPWEEVWVCRPWGNTAVQSVMRGSGSNAGKGYGV